MKPIVVVIAFFGLVGLGWIGSQFVNKTGSIELHSKVSNTDQIESYEKAQGVFDARCVSCHSCYTAPCQLKLSSHEGILRGLHPSLVVYNNKRIKSEKQLTRLGIDAETTAQWKNNHGFRSILEKDDQGTTVLEEVLSAPRLTAHQLKDLPPSEFSHQCLKNDSPPHPMPYGLAPIKDWEKNILKNWLQKDRLPIEEVKAHYTLPQTLMDAKKDWENYFNRRGKKQQLIARYIYEHLFLAHVYLEENSTQFFELYRSSSACENPSVIPSRRPYDDPGGSFYYCLRPVQSTIVHKNHITYPLTAQKRKRLETLFETNKFGSWEVSTLPSYDIKTSSNPFITFQDIPADARYQYLLDNAQYFVRTFIRGPVCKGPSALNVIHEQFYVMFVNPKSYSGKLDAFIMKNQKLLDQPAMFGSDIDINSVFKNKIPHIPEAAGISKVMFGTSNFAKAFSIFTGFRKPKKGLSRNRMDYRKKRYQFFKDHRPKGYSFDDIWDGGEDKNDNALLTVVRHFDSAFVAKGPLGPMPSSLWLIDFPLLESIYYDLVAGFDVYGDLTHQAATRYYKSSLRVDGEEHFLYLVPKDARDDMKHYLYRNGRRGSFNIRRITLNWYPMSLISHEETPEYIIPSHLNKEDFSRKEQAKIREIVFNAIYENRFASTYGNLGERQTSAHFAAINGKRRKKNKFVYFLRDVSFIKHKNDFYTLIKNKEHFNVTWHNAEALRRDYDNDIIFAQKGFFGSYPNYFYDISKLASPKEFADRLAAIVTEDEFQKFEREFGIAGTDPRFWDIYDFFTKRFKETDPREAGIFDLNRYGLGREF